MYSDLKPLIALLEKASASTNAGEQLATIELGLVAAELSAEEYEFVELLTGLKLLAGLNLTGRAWNSEIANLTTSEA